MLEQKLLAEITIKNYYSFNLIFLNSANINQMLKMYRFVEVAILLNWKIAYKVRMPSYLVFNNDIFWSVFNLFLYWTKSNLNTDQE